MIKEQAIEILRYNTDLGHGVIIENESTESIYEALDMAIKALEQPTSDDCVSRTDLLSQINKSWEIIETKLDFVNIVKALPPVTPTHKVGKWIKTGGSFRCSECLVMPEFKDIRTLKYCPNCGAKMIKE